jgi:hypothetical protein
VVPVQPHGIFIALENVEHVFIQSCIPSYRSSDRAHAIETLARCRLGLHHGGGLTLSLLVVYSAFY